jgi:hypothetical protein
MAGGDQHVTSLTGIWQSGQIVLDGVADWPDGCRVLIEPLSMEGSLGLSEEQWRDSPEAVAEWIQWYESLESLEITADERVRSSLSPD